MKFKIVVLGLLSSVLASAVTVKHQSCDLYTVDYGALRDAETKSGINLENYVSKQGFNLIRVTGDGATSEESVSELRNSLQKEDLILVFNLKAHFKDTAFWERVKDPTLPASVLLYGVSRVRVEKKISNKMVSTLYTNSATSKTLETSFEAALAQFPNCELLPVVTPTVVTPTVVVSPPTPVVPTPSVVYIYLPSPPVVMTPSVVAPVPTPTVAPAKLSGCHCAPGENGPHFCYNEAGSKPSFYNLQCTNGKFALGANGKALVVNSLSCSVESKCCDSSYFYKKVLGSNINYIDYCAQLLTLKKN